MSGYAHLPNLVSLRLQLFCLLLIQGIQPLSLVVVKRCCDEAEVTQALCAVMLQVEDDKWTVFEPESARPAGIVCGIKPCNMFKAMDPAAMFVEIFWRAAVSALRAINEAIC